MLIILSGVFTIRVQLSGSSTKYGIPWRLNSYIVHGLSMRTEVKMTKAAIVYSTNTQQLTCCQFEINYFHRNNSSIIGYIIDSFKRCLAFLGLWCHNSCKKILDNNGDYFPSWLKPYNNAKTDKITMYTTSSTMETMPRFFFPSLRKIIELIEKLMSSYITRLRYEVWK